MWDDELQALLRVRRDDAGFPTISAHRPEPDGALENQTAETIFLNHC